MCCDYVKGDDAMLHLGLIEELSKGVVNYVQNLYAYTFWTERLLWTAICP